MGKIWSQVQDACKNVVKLAATSVGRAVKDASKSVRSQRNPVEVADATLVGSSSSSRTGSGGGICGETCRKNLMRAKSRSDSKKKRAIEDSIGKYREDFVEVSAWKIPPRAIALSRRDTHARRNAEKRENEKSCVFYSGTINSNQSSAHTHVYLLH